MRFRYLTFTLVLLTATTPAHASLGAASQCVAPSQELSIKTVDIKSPLPELPRITSTYDPEDRDYLIRTIVFEASEESEEGKAAVAHVILNRERSGRWGESIKQVVTRPWQFEPWMTRRSQMVALSQSDPRYQGAARIADAVLSGQNSRSDRGRYALPQPDHRTQTARWLSAGMGARRGPTDRPAHFLCAKRRCPRGRTYRASHGRFGHIPSSMLWA